MNATLDDLRAALHEEADAAAYPDVEALVAGARQRAGAARRRRLTALSAATAAVLVVSGLVATTASTHRAAPPPAGPGPGPYASAAGFPAYLDGMMRLKVLDVPMVNQSNTSISVPTTAGRKLAVRLTCTPYEIMTKVPDWNNKMIADVKIVGGQNGRAQCDGGIGPSMSLIGVTTGARTTLLADIFIDYKKVPAAATLFKDAKFHVGIYESVPHKDYPIPSRPADLETNPRYAWSSLPGSVWVVGPQTADRANEPWTFTKPYDPKLSLNLEVRGPGQIRVLINGRDVGGQTITSNVIGNTDLIQSDVISFTTYESRGFNFSLDPSFWDPGLPTTKPGTPLTVKIIATDFAGPDWRVELVPAQ
jgi:hypothetical protein